jgi:heptosyltransferase-2
VPQVLLIKTGETETFADGVSAVPSLGDVLRATVLLHAFAGDEVTWLTSAHAAPLLAGNSRIARLLVHEHDAIGELSDCDVLVNLERTERWTALAARSSIRSKFGFSATGALRLADEMGWQQGLYSLVGRSWAGEEYVIGDVLPSHRSDVGLNWQVGGRWPTKAWPLAQWEQLATRLQAHCAVSWQEGFDDLHQYMRWIAGCGSLVTTDSLGMHLAIALKKPVLALFGPTPHWEVDFYGRGRWLAPLPGAFACAPCRSPICFNPTHCMTELSVERVLAGAMSMISTEVWPKT